MNWNVKFFMRLKELRWSVPRLVEEMNIEGAKEANAAADRIRKWRPKDDRRPIAHPHDDGMLERAVIAMGKSMDWLSASQHDESTTTNVGAGEGMNAPVNDNVNLKLPQQLIGFIPQRVPLPSTAGSEEILVYGLVNGGQAVEILSNEPFDTTTRPESLAHVKDAYAVMVSGESMYPRLKSGWVVHINPHLPPMQGDTCIFLSEGPDGARFATIKEFRKQTETHWHIRQYNPEKDFTLKKSEWAVTHVVVHVDFRRR